MMPGGSSGHPGLVPHPRFGDRVQPSGYEVSAEESRSAFWRTALAVACGSPRPPAGSKK